VTALAVVLVTLGVFFLFMGALGLLRFPDFYTRMHAAGKCDTLGSLLVFLGLAIYQGFDLVSLKLLLIALFIFLTSPTATHAMAWAARRNQDVLGAGREEVRR
jgi:multicomponent Na+:H+ antiporter subunit G